MTSSAAIARNLLAKLAVAKGWPASAVERILNPAANHGCVTSGTTNDLRWSVFCHSEGFLFEVARCGHEANGPIYVGAVINDYDTLVAAAKRWCERPQLDLFI